MSKGVDLIITIVNRGFAEEAMEAAKAAGATGGTILHGRGTGSKQAAEFFGATISPEKEMVLTVVRKETKKDIMQSIIKAAGVKTRGSGLVFSLPVEDVMGTAQLLADDDED